MKGPPATKLLEVNNSNDNNYYIKHSIFLSSLETRKISKEKEKQNKIQRSKNLKLKRRKRQPTPVFLPGKVHGQRSLAGCSPWGYMTEHAHMRMQGDGLVAINW